MQIGARFTLAQVNSFTNSRGLAGAGSSVSPAKNARYPVNSAGVNRSRRAPMSRSCLLYTSDAADD